MNRRQLLLGATAAVVAPVLPPEVIPESLWGGDPILLLPYRRVRMCWLETAPGWVQYCGDGAAA